MVPEQPTAEAVAPTASTAHSPSALHAALADISRIANDKQWRQAQHQLSQLQHATHKRTHHFIQQLQEELAEQEARYFLQAEVGTLLAQAQWLDQATALYKDRQQATHKSFKHAVLLHHYTEKRQVIWQQLIAKSMLLAKLGHTELAQQAMQYFTQRVDTEHSGTLSNKTMLNETMQISIAQLQSTLNQAKTGAQLLFTAQNPRPNNIEKSALTALKQPPPPLATASPVKQTTSKGTHKNTRTHKQRLSSLQEALTTRDPIIYKSLLDKLAQDSQLSFDQALTVSAMRYALIQQIGILDQHADLLYSEGDISAAHSIWALLLELNPDSEDIKAKLDRSQRVMNNIEELRNDGFVNAEDQARESN